MPRKVHDLNEVHPIDCPVVRQVRIEFSDCTWFYDHGYIRYNDGTKTMLREHQRVAQIAYGAINGQHVHHIDGNRLNNAAVNLAVLSPTEHRDTHRPRRKSEHVMLVCPVCAKAFPTTAYRANQRGRTYCSSACLRFARRIVERPSKETLASLIATVNNWSELGRRYGVSDNAIRKWARGYQLI